MAIGVSLCFNIELPINFDSPYKAYSFRDFWKRWHISLTKWFTKYVYIPLGGNRKGTIITIRNTMIVFLISGFWHGANWTFVLWGGIHGICSVLDRLISKWYRKMHNVAQWIITFGSVSILWWLFRSESINAFIHRMLSMCKFRSLEINDNIINAFNHPEQNIIYVLTNTVGMEKTIRGLWMNFFFVIALMGCLSFENTYKRNYKNSVMSVFLTAIMLLISITCLSSQSAFIYNGF